MDLYADNILDHYRHPRNKSLNAERGTRNEAGESEISNQKFTPSVVYRESNPACGDELTLSLVIEDNSIRLLTWSGTGCAISQAAMSMLSEELTGLSPQQADSLTKQDMYDMLGVPISPRRMKCALLGLHALKNALRTHAGEQVAGWMDTVSLQ